jgi:hypothetical protein
MTLWPRTTPANIVATMEEARLITTIMGRKAARGCWGKYNQKNSALPYRVSWGIIITERQGPGVEAFIQVCKEPLHQRYSPEGGKI